MLKRIFDKHGVDSTESVEPIDASIVALSRELSGLARLEVTQAAKERGWAAVERELKRRPAPAASRVAPKGIATEGGVRVDPGRAARVARARSRRWALGSAAAAVVVIVTLIGAFGGGLFQSDGPGIVGTTGSSVATSDSTEPGTTVVTGSTTIPSGTSVTTQVPDTDGGSPGTSETPSPSDGTSDVTNTTGSSTGTSSPPSTEPTTTTTNAQQYAAAQREKTAKAAALNLGAMVVHYFDTGDMSGARSLVASQAQASLVQMISSLNEPMGYNIVSTKSLSDDTVRITLEFQDRVADGLGQPVEISKRFNVTVHVDDEGAVIIAISAGS